MAIAQSEKDQLDERGFVILEDVVSLAMIDAVQTRIEQLFAEEGDGAGSEFKQEDQCRRLANLVDKGPIFGEAITVPKLLECVKCVLGPKIKLSSCNARSVNAHSTVTQPLHSDMAAVADRRGYWVANVAWMLDDFSADNGAVRLIPGSHRWGALPQEKLADPTAPHPDQILLTGKRGTILVMNAHIWHGGLANRTSAPRTALHAFYCRRDKPQQQYQKQLLRPAVQATLSAELRDLLALDDPSNDEITSRPATRSGFLK